MELHFILETTKLRVTVTRAQGHQLVTGRLTSSEFTKPHPRARVLLSQEESKKVAAYIRRETRRTFSVS